MKQAQSESIPRETVDQTYRYGLLYDMMLVGDQFHKLKQSQK